MRALLSEPSARTLEYVAWLNGTPVGAIEVFVGSECAGIHGLTVPERYQGRGIASALIERACIDLRDRGADRIGLLASAEGQRLYVRRGFQKWRSSRLVSELSARLLNPIHTDVLCRYGPRSRLPTSMRALRRWSAWTSRVIKHRNVLVARQDEGSGTSVRLTRGAHAA